MKKTVLVLGAGSDIGQSIAQNFESEGFEVIKALRHPTHPGEMHFDAAQTDAHARFVASLPTLPDVVVQVFGLLPKAEEAFSNPALAIEAARVNYVGAISVLGHLAKEMAQRGNGTIIGISSVAGDRGRASNYLYGSTKAALSTYLDGLRGKLAPFGVHVILVKPGFVRTKMTAHLPLPGPLTATPQQVAQSVVRAYRSQRNTVYVLPIWRWVMVVIALIPESIFNKMKF